MKKTIFRTLAASALCAAAWAQGPPPGPPDRGGFGPGMEMGMRPGKVVAGAPYSAIVTFSATQTLSDGNTIQHTTTGSVARDAQGRTREQITSDRGPFGQAGPTTVTFIADPVAGYAYTLNASTKVALRRVLRTAPAGANRSGSRHGGPSFEGGPAADNRLESDLGTQVVGGVSATGKTVTHTVPAGAMGNAQAITSTNETWYSPDLQVPVLAKRNDPRFGQSTYSLTNIQRVEPAASLFQIPSDYTITDAPKFSRSGGPPAPPE